MQPAPEADRRTLARRAVPRSDRPAADDRSKSRIRERQIARCLRKIRRSFAGLAALGRASSPLLARLPPATPIRTAFTSTTIARSGRFRDWVINAFNRNEPFDQFTIEQLAGDLIAEPHARSASRLGLQSLQHHHERRGRDRRRIPVIYARDRTETTSQVWLGLTAGCAVCHDHKFDPLSQREFYSLSAFFNNTTEPAMDGNMKDTPPVIFVPQPADRKQWDALAAEIADRPAANGRTQERRPESNSTNG